MKCHEHDCEDPATMKVSWPGRGWIFYCNAHGQYAVRILEDMGSLGAVELLEPTAEERK